MNILTLIPLVEKVLVTLLSPRVHRSMGSLISTVRRPGFSYESLSLSYELDIRDLDGARARLTRDQEVLFLTSEAGVVRDLVWGDGEQSVGYRASGAEPMATRQEGMARVVWLGLQHSPRAGERAKVRTARTIVDGLGRDEEFLEVRVERPTKRLRLRVLFPEGRPPRSAILETSSNRHPRRSLVPRLVGTRQRLSWSVTGARTFETYRLRWTW